MEALQTRTLFGELDHPEGDRCETLAKNAAISITKLEKRPEEGVIYGEADILDTPTGRIVKALADSGAKLGISSRGMGEEIYSEGRNIIDPETYDFITFDVVVTPANTKARVALTESKELNKLTESIKYEISESETENQLNQLKAVLENVQLSNKEELVALIENKINNISNKKKNKFEEANQKIVLDILKKQLKSKTEQYDELIKASASLSFENAKLVENNKFYEDSRTMLKTKLKENNNKIASLNKVESSNKSLKEENESLKTKYNNLLKENKILAESIKKYEAQDKETIIKMRKMNEAKINNIEKTNTEKLEKLNEEKEIINKKYINLIETNKELSKKLESTCKILKEREISNKSLLEKYNNLQKESTLTTKKLQENKTSESNKIKMLEEEIKQLKEKAKLNEEAERNFSKLSFSPLGKMKAIRENFEVSDYSDDDKALFDILTNR